MITGFKESYYSIMYFLIEQSKFLFRKNINTFV